MARMTRVGVGFAAKVQGLVLATVGLMAGAVYSFGGFFYDLTSGGLNRGTALAFMALVGMPLAFAAFGLAAGAVGAVLYNLVAPRVGGVELDVHTRG
jgi:hypothetical protein